MMMYLTRVAIEAMEVTRYRLGDPYRWHQEIWKAFPGVPEGTEQEFLFRIERKESHTTLWILSGVEPQPLSWGYWETKPVAQTFLNHNRYEFVLCANPTVMRVVRLDDGSRKKNGRRTAIYGENELKQWLVQKGEAAGFRVEQSCCLPPVKEYFYKRNQLGVHVRVDFQGVLTVTDQTAFETAWKNGIGPAKAFGFGLLLLKPLA
ncbi:MAG: type I-E CRISPR-associated protein Cas6/Cse3/CasE [Thermoguttaceae bacterium]|nr:type I-E CRISPR-associated protein Cas6/Cse3/CasE [Thermoguttaceae bacterium]